MSSEQWQRVTELFQEALGRSPEDRQAFLRQICGGDLNLKRTVEALLDADEEAGEFMEDPPVLVPPCPGAQ